MHHESITIIFLNTGFIGKRSHVTVSTICSIGNAFLIVADCDCFVIAWMMHSLAYVLC